MGDHSANSQRVRRTASIQASTIARLNTYLSFLAFLAALVLGCLLHYKKIVKNSVAGYPQEWFPSVSATIGDWYPERSIFQILCACAAGPRFASIVMQYNQTSLQLPSSSIPVVLLVTGIIRTLSCGGWMFITSSDDHDTHDFFMILYIVCNLPWMYSCITTSPSSSPETKRRRSLFCAMFFFAIVPLIYFFIQHKVHRVPGAYTRYSFFEWGLIICDILFDSVAYEDLSLVEIQLVFSDTPPETFTSNSSSTLEENSMVPSHGLSGESQTPKVPHDTDTDATAIPPYQLASREWTEYASDLYAAYIFWSIFTSVIPTLFWFSVWELGIAGHELALLSCLAPIVYVSKGALDFTQTRGGSTTLHLCSLLGLLAYIVPGSLGRLFCVTVANIAAVLHQVAFWSRSENDSSLYPGFVFTLGLLLSSLLKHINYSINPVWPFADLQSWPLNTLGFVLAVLAVIEQHNRSSWEFRTVQTKESQRNSSFRVQDHLRTSLPLGSLFFTLHSMMSDSSTLVAWSWTGYTDYKPNGPLPHYHGILTLLAQALGIIALVLLSSRATATQFILHPSWFMAGMSCFYITYRYQDWLGFGGALGFSVFVMSIAPVLMRPRWPREKTGQVYFVAMLTYCILGLSSVWTVAYAFVPGGNYLRERSDIVCLLQAALFAPAFYPARSKTKPVGSRMRYSASSFFKTTISLISVAAMLSTIHQRPVIPPRPQRNSPSVITAGIWTLHFGLNNHGRDSQRQLQKLITNLELDVVGLLETDLHRVVFGQRDLTLRIVQDAGYYVDLGPTGPKSHTWGAVLLSKFPIINSTHHLLPSPNGELAPAIEAVLDVNGTPVTVVVAHNGQEEDPLDRELQSKELARIMAASYPRPVIFLGYVVTKPLAKRPNPYEILVTDGKVHDIDQEDADRWCEYILYRGLYRTAYARVSRGTVTDTELQVGQFILPRLGHDVVDDSEAARYLRSWKEDLPTYLWMPMDYYGGGVDRHFYHVFGTPLYYKLPEGAVV